MRILHQPVPWGRGMSWELSVAVCGAGEAETPWCNKNPMTSILSYPYIHRLSDMESNDID